MNVEELLSHGTWEEYRRSSDVRLTDLQETQLKSLTVVSRCHNRSIVPYAELQAATDIRTTKELEHLVIHHCIYTGLLSAKLDQRSEQLHVFKTAPRKVSPEKLDRMIMSLSAWLDQAHKVSFFLDGVGRSLDETTEATAVAARAKTLAAAFKERELVAGKDGDDSEDLLGEKESMKTDAMENTQKSKRRRGKMEINAEVGVGTDDKDDKDGADEKDDSDH